MTRSSSQFSLIVHPLRLALVSVLVLATGCKGCEDAAPSPAASAEPEPDTVDLEQLKARLTALNLDLSKPYSKRADGVVECGEDKVCFLAQLERCQPALLEHKVRERAGLLLKDVHARYRVEGRRDDRCALQRLVLRADVELPDDTRKALADKGKQQLEVDLMLAEAGAMLKGYMVPRLTCLFSEGRALELGLDMVESKSFDRHFEEPCDEVGSEDEWPADLAAPAPPAAQ